MGYRINRKPISIICYADDATILAETADNLRRQLHRFNQVSTQFNMKISISKTKCMTVARELTRCKPVIINEIVGQVTTFKYLGGDISSRHEPFKDLKSQINKASLTSGCLRDVIWNNKQMSIDSKVRIRKTCVRPILAFGIETRADTNKTKCMLRTAEMMTLRSIAGKTLRDRVRSVTIRQTCKVEDVIRWGRKCRRWWRDHVERMHPERIAKIASNVNPAAKRPIGRPPKRWEDSWTSISQENQQH
uniref:Reverse transcriptase domain-containing protein n=1 Tax=Dendroctonus ponderosae TaxID=77166 RepID=A0AAR5QD25_DENPD